jgi:hypothetical protein
MYDVNPLGPMMHLKELDRQAAQKIWLLRSRRQGVFSFTGIKLVIGFLQYLHAFHLFGAQGGIPPSTKRLPRAS